MPTSEVIAALRSMMDCDVVHKCENGVPESRYRSIPIGKVSMRWLSTSQVFDAFDVFDIQSVLFVSYDLWIRHNRTKMGAETTRGTPERKARDHVNDTQETTAGDAE